MNERPDRTYIIWLLGGVYLLYLTVKLGRSIMEGALGITACVFPILFSVSGIILIVKGIRQAKKEREGLEEPEDEDTSCGE